MANELNGKRVAAIVADGFEQVELIDPQQALEAAGAKVEIISPEQGRVARLESHRLGHGCHGR